MNHDIRSQIQRSNKVRRCNRAVYKERQIIFVSKSGKLGNVRHVKFRVANRFNINQLGLVGEESGKILNAIFCDVVDLNAEIF